jgi:5-methylcytosine-specific restriction protein A
VTSRWGDRSRHERGYGTAWTKLRQSVLRRDKGLCQPCLKVGRISRATSVDHIRPKANGGTDDDSNLRSICDACRAEKDAIDRGRPLRNRGRDDWPQPW